MLMTVMVLPFLVDTTAATFFTPFSAMVNQGLLLSWSPISSILDMVPGFISIRLLSFNVFSRSSKYDTVFSLFMP